MVNTEKHNGFDPNEALNNLKFVEFLAHFPEETENDPAQMAERFELFESVNVAIESIREAYKQDIEKNMGIKLSEEELKNIDAFYYKKTVNDPEYVLQTKKVIDIYKKQKSEVINLEAEIKALGKPEDLNKELTELQKKEEKYTVAKEFDGTLGWLALSWNYFSETLDGDNTESERKIDILEKAKKEGITKDKKEVGKVLTQTQKKIKEIQDKLALITNTEQKKEESASLHEGARAEIFAQLRNVDDLEDLIQKKTTEMFAEMQNKKGGVIEMIKFAKKVKEGRDNSESGIDPLGLRGNAGEVFENNLEKAIEALGKKEILEAVQNFKPGKTPLNDLEKALKPFPFNKELIVEALEEAVEDLGNSNLDKAKKILIGQVIINLSEEQN